MRLSQREYKVLGHAYFHKTFRVGDALNTNGRGNNANKTMDSLFRKKLIEVCPPDYYLYQITALGQEVWAAHVQRNRDIRAEKGK